MAEQEKLGFAERFYHELDDLGLCCVGLGIIYPLKLTTVSSGRHGMQDPENQTTRMMLTYAL